MAAGDMSGPFQAVFVIAVIFVIYFILSSIKVNDLSPDGIVM